eukprot:s3899_g1.t1
MQFMQSKNRTQGSRAFERLIDPFVSGVYAGDPSTLSAEAATGRVQVLEKNAGSLVAGAIKLFQDRASKPAEPRDPRLPQVKGQTVGSFRKGLKQFSDALCEDVAKHGSPVRLNWKLTKLAYDKQTEMHVLDYDTPEGPKRLRSKALILTSPSYITAPLLKEVCSPAAEALEGIRYPRVAAVTVEYHKSAFREPAHGKGIVNGFGQLHPRSQGIRTLGTIYSSSLFPNRMPDDDKIMLLHYIGGARDPELFGGIQDLSEGQLVEATHKDTVETMLHSTEASRLPKALGVRVWDRAIPQLEVGHQKRLDTVKESLSAEGVKGVYLAGNYVGGVALGRCVEFGIEVAQEAGRHPFYIIMAETAAMFGMVFVAMTRTHRYHEHADGSANTGLQALPPKERHAEHLPRLRLASSGGGHCRTPSASFASQWALPDFICELQMPVGNAGLELRLPDPSGHCRTASASSRSQWATPDFIRELQMPVGTAGLEPRVPEASGHCRAAAASRRGQWALPDCNVYTSQKECQRECQRECQIECQRECQKECWKECQTIDAR